MPHINVMIGSDGAVIEVTIAVGPVWREALVLRGAAPPPPVTIRALIDTGADITAIHPRILQQSGGRPIGSARIRRPGHGNDYELASVCEVQLSIGGANPGSPWIAAQVAGVSPSTRTALALIGRDVLRHCTLFYNGPRDELTLSY